MVFFGLQRAELSIHIANFPENGLIYVNQANVMCPNYANGKF